MGRPTLYSEELGIEIASRSAAGESLLKITSARGMPSMRTLQEWRHRHPELNALLDRAHLDRAQIYFEESITIADEDVADAAQAQRNRLRVQARQWAAARLDPARFSDRVINAHIVPSDPARPFAQMTRDERLMLAHRLAFVLRRGLQDAMEAKAGQATIGDGRAAR